MSVMLINDKVRFFKIGNEVDDDVGIRGLYFSYY